MIEGKKGYDPTSFLNNVKPQFLALIDEQKKPTKVKSIFQCRFIRINKETGDIVKVATPYFHSLMETITEATDISDIFDKMSALQIESAHNFEEIEDSEWRFDRVIDLRIHINPFQPFSGSSYIPLPPKLASKKAIINVKNENDHECFKWAITSAVFPRDKNAERLNKEMRENSEKFDWSGIEFPVSAVGTNQIDKFEKQNPYGINVLGYENKGPAKRIQHHPTLLNPTLLDDVAQCWTRWPNECNMLDSTLGLERSGSKSYPESLQNKRAPYWFSQKMARDRSTVKRYLAALALLEMLEEEDDRVTRKGKTRHWIKAKGRKGIF